MDMAQEERVKEVVEEITETEKQFLKDLYVFMKKRNTPIERIPNLGFKQSTYRFLLQHILCVKTVVGAFIIHYSLNRHLLF